ncbi:MAG TPA: hypothetical protein DCZ13_10485 [Porticoccaceae bacterium]|nr:hypothetical protein [Porticoccaceae bacterium]
MKMPAAESEALAQRDELLAELGTILPAERIIADEPGLRTYDCDALTAYRQTPMLVVLPDKVDEVSKILAVCDRRGIKVVARGAGTSVSGGALPLADCVLLAMARFNRILDIDYDNRCVTAQCGVTNLALSEAVAERGFYYAPDPSSQIACTIGGNVAENSGGVHCLKYGMTTNNLLGLELVLMDGTVLRIGGKHLDAEGYDLLGLLTGSEGLLGVITEVTVRILPRPETARAVLAGFSDDESAGQVVADIIAAGIIPAGLEMMDKFIIQATEDFCHAGYPLDVAALLIVELDGPEVEVDHLVQSVVELAERGGAMLDAPVSGADVRAIEGTLSIMAGGDPVVFQRCLPVLQVLGGQITHMGDEVGAGGYAKLANQIMVAINLASMGEALVFGAKAGLDVGKLVQALAGGAANSEVLRLKSDKVLGGHFTPGGRAEVQLKDLNYIGDSMAVLGISLPVTDLVHELYRQLVAAGFGGDDHSAIIRIFERMTGVEARGGETSAVAPKGG